MNNFQRPSTGRTTRFEFTHQRDKKSGDAKSRTQKFGTLPIIAQLNAALQKVH